MTVMNAPSAELQNGFGGMNKEMATYALGKIEVGTKAWNKHCAGKSLHDVTFARHLLK